MTTHQASDHSFAATAAKMAGVSAPELAALLAITQPAAWDLLAHPEELSYTLSLRQLQRLAARLEITTLSLCGGEQAAGAEHHSLPELADQIQNFCARQQLSAEQFGEMAGWSLQTFLVTPDSALDDWCLDTLVDVCRTAGVHWPACLPG